MFNEGFKYWLAYTKNKISYYRCARHKEKCPGRCVLDKGKIRNLNRHNHEPEPDRVLVDQFRKVLTKRAANEYTDLYTIYWDEASQRHLDAALLYTFAAAESAMRKARRKKLQPLPHNASELGDVLRDSPLFKVHSGTVPQQFYQETLVFESARCIVFAHLNTLQRIDPVEEMHVDGTLTVSPNYHLLTFHSVQSTLSTPIVYVVVTSRTQSVYASVFAYIRENYSAYISPTSIISNFDPNVQAAAAFTYPEATVKGFWLEYTLAVLKKMKSLNLQRQTARGHGSSCLRMLMVLPLLPADYMTPGLDAVRKWADEKKILTDDLSNLCKYIGVEWLRAVGAHKMSMFGIPHAIHNHAQEFNKELNETLNGATKRSIWKAMEAITQIATRTYVRVKKRHRRRCLATAHTADAFNAQPPPQPPAPKKCHAMRSDLINEATQQWIRTPVHLRNPLQFLQMTSHCINDTLYYVGLDELNDKQQQLQQQQQHSQHIMPAMLPSMPSSVGAQQQHQQHNMHQQQQHQPQHHQQQQQEQFTNDYNFPSTMSLDQTFDINNSCMYQGLNNAPQQQRNYFSHSDDSATTVVTAQQLSTGHFGQSIELMGGVSTNSSIIHSAAATDFGFLSSPMDNQPHHHQQCGIAGGGAMPTTMRPYSSDPPPLAFFPKTVVVVKKPTFKPTMPSEPPPSSN